MPSKPCRNCGLLPPSILSEPLFVEARLWLGRTLGFLTLILPAAVYVASLRRGVPLPLISYSGSFVLMIMFGLGIVNSVWVHRKFAR